MSNAPFTLFKGNEGVEESGESFLLFGLSGSGKSLSISTLRENTLVIKHPGEPQTGNHYKGMDHIVTCLLEAEPAEPGSDVVTAYRAFKTVTSSAQLQVWKKKGVKNIVFDSLTVLSSDYERYFTYLNGGQMEFEQWRLLKNEMVDLITRVNNIGLNIIFICWADMERETISGISKAYPMTRGSFGKEIAHYVSETKYCFAQKDPETKEERWYWQHYADDRAISRTMVKGMPKLTEQNFDIYDFNKPKQETEQTTQSNED